MSNTRTKQEVLDAWRGIPAHYIAAQLTRFTYSIANRQDL